MVTLAQSVNQVILFKKTSAIDVKNSALHAQNKMFVRVAVKVDLSF
jgi:hypothetical protein